MWSGSDGPGFVNWFFTGPDPSFSGVFLGGSGSSGPEVLKQTSILVEVQKKNKLMFRVLITFT